MSFAHDMNAKTMGKFESSGSKFRGHSPRYNSLKKLNTNRSSKTPKGRLKPVAWALPAT
ncbi:hypothetical protein QP713_06905 [Neisseria mucosa]|uniref:Uncharacterized protein n=1 Tax=Neisseria mucosa TaxID=488 RepID=A0AAW6ZDT5_NEIMU|nr:hypothetical protein [Neisseria mucosa]MDK6726517.1 hypothetical protein [Neisseria mucosa]MDK6870910.1 hypothetical protein [Neisseria mucosa]MDK8110513.1 hypothetical protein [Neisseria mucosa]MDK8361782.1 hypothetical protein [Neisseria mucosa]